MFKKRKRSLTLHCAALCLPGPIALSVQCKLVAAGAVVAGTMSITRSEVYFEMDDDEANNKKLEPQVSLLSYLGESCWCLAGSRLIPHRFVSFRVIVKNKILTESAEFLHILFNNML